MKPIAMVGHGLHVEPLLEQLDARPEVWNAHTMRTDFYGGPHGGISDIWVRYRPWEDFDGDVEAFNGPHDSAWYPVCDAIPAARELAEQVRYIVGATEIGGVLITRIPPGGEVKPHVDRGWHAETYAKFAVQLRSAPGQAFCFEDAWLSPMPGDLYTFDNSKSHWVINPTAHERMTMIVCLK